MYLGVDLSSSISLGICMFFQSEKPWPCALITSLVLFLFPPYSIFLFSFSAMPINQMLELKWFSKMLTFSPLSISFILFYFMDASEKVSFPKFYSGHSFLNKRSFVTIPPNFLCLNVAVRPGVALLWCLKHLKIMRQYTQKLKGN